MKAVIKYVQCDTSVILKIIKITQIPYKQKW